MRSAIMREVRAYFESLLTDRNVAERVRKYLDISTVETGNNVEWVAEFGSGASIKETITDEIFRFIPIFPWNDYKPDKASVEHFTDANADNSYEGDGTVITLHEQGIYMIYGSMEFAASVPTVVEDWVEFGFSAGNNFYSGYQDWFFTNPLQQGDVTNYPNRNQMEHGYAYFTFEPQDEDYWHQFTPSVRASKKTQFQNVRINVVKLTSNIFPDYF
jgi:hypothetical protein